MNFGVGFINMQPESGMYEFSTCSREKRCFRIEYDSLVKSRGIEHIEGMWCCL